MYIFQKNAPKVCPTASIFLTSNGIGKSFFFFFFSSSCEGKSGTNSCALHGAQERHHTLYSVA